MTLPFLHDHVVSRSSLVRLMLAVAVFLVYREAGALSAFAFDQPPSPLASVMPSGFRETFAEYAANLKTSQVILGQGPIPDPADLSGRGSTRSASSVAPSVLVSPPSTLNALPQQTASRGSAAIAGLSQSDFDNDGDVDFDDLLHLTTCLSGAGIAPLDPGCANADLDHDDDVDLDDFGLLQGMLSGPAPKAEAGGPYVVAESAVQDVCGGLWQLTLDARGSQAGDPGNPIVSCTWAGHLFRKETFDGTAVDGGRWNAANAMQNDSITVSGQGDWGPSYVFTKEQAARADGIRIQAEITFPSLSHAMWGLKHDVASTSYTAMPYAIYFINNGNINIYEDGNDRGAVGTYSAGASYQVRIDVKPTAGATYYYRPSNCNEWRLLYDSSYGGASGFVVGTTVHSGALVMDDMFYRSQTISGDLAECWIDAEGDAVLTVINQAGQTANDTAPIRIDGQVPVASPGGPYAAPVGASIVFDGRTSTDDFMIASYTWEFGDGSSVTSSGSQVVHAYSSIGTRDVALTVTDRAGRKSTEETTVQVVGAAVCVPWDYHPVTGSEIQHPVWDGLSTRLKAVVYTDTPANQLTYRWDFGDGSAPESGAITNKRVIEAVHAYQGSPETLYTAQLTVQDPVHGELTDTYPVAIKPKDLTLEVNVALDEGLWWLHKSQETGGNWPKGSGYCNTGAIIASTAATITVMQTNRHIPARPVLYDPIVDDVLNGLHYLLNNLQAVSINMQTYGDPDSNCNGKALRTIGSGDFRPAYTVGAVMDALAATGSPDLVADSSIAGVGGRSLRSITQDLGDWYSWAQSENGTSRGGWRYGVDNNTDADNSVCQWAAIGFLGAKAGFGLDAPAWVKSANAYWLTQSFNGSGFGYEGKGAGDATTPSGMIQLAFDGVTRDDPQWQAAEHWIDGRWSTWLNTGWHYYAQYAFAKAMRVALPKPIERLQPSDRDWYGADDGLARHILSERYDDGSWGKGTHSYWNNNLSTPWALAILTPTIYTLKPVANAGDDVIWAFDRPLVFDGSHSYHGDPALTITEYQWDFGDGTPQYVGTEPITQHVYPYDPGITYPKVYQTSLTVRDVLGQSHTDYRQVTIAEPPHAPFAKAGGPYTVSAGVPFHPDGSKSYDIDPGDYITHQEWDFSAANGYNFDQPDAAVDCVSAGCPQITWVFTTPGIYNIGLRVWDNAVLHPENNRLASLPDYTTVTVVNNEPPVALLGGPYEVEECQPMQFDGSGSTDPNGDALTYAWDFNDDGQYDDATGPAPTWTWQDNGIYAVSLIVSDGALQSPAVTTQVTVRDTAPVVTLSGPPVAASDQPAHLEATITASCDEITAVEWDWDFDGMTFRSSGDVGAAQDHAWETHGDYTVAIRVTDEDGSTAMARHTLSVLAPGAPRKPANGRIKVIVGRRDYDPERGVHSAQFTLVSEHSAPITGPVGLAFDKIDPATVTLLAPDGEVPTTDNPPRTIPYVSFSDLLQNNVLRPGESIGPKWVEFADPGNAAFTFDAIPYVFNTPPRITSKPVTAASEGSRYRYDVNAVDDDGDAIMYSLQAAPAGMSIDPVSGLIDWVPGQTEAGQHQVTVAASDQVSEGQATQSYIIAVGGVNVAPVITSEPDTTGKPGMAYQYAVQAFDPDGDPLVYALSVAPADMAINGATGLVTWTPPAPGTYSVTVVVSDGQGHQAEQSYTITVVACDQPPTIVSQPTTTATEGQLYSYQVQTTAAAGSSLFYSLPVAPMGMAVDSTGRILWTPSYTSAGMRTVKVVVCTQIPGCQAEQIFQVNVANTNAAPRITSTPVTSATEGLPYRYEMQAVDPDGDPVAWTLIAGPEGMDIHPVAGILRWLPSQAAAAGGPYPVTVQATDPFGAASQQNFEIVVGSVDVAPRIVSSPVYLAIEAQAYRYDVEAVDPDNDPLTYALVKKPQGMSIDAATGLIQWTPAYQTSTSSPYQVEIVVTDPAKHEARQAFEIVVRKNNQPPVITSQPVLQAAEGEIYRYIVTATDPNDDVLTFSLVKSPSGMNIHPATGAIDWLVPQDAAATVSHQVILAVTDGVATVQQVFDIAVEGENVAPTIISKAITRAVLGEEYRYDVEAVDQDGDILTYALTENPAGMSIDPSTGLIVWMPAEDQFGLHTVRVTVTDPFNASTEQSFTLQVPKPYEPGDPETPEMPAVAIISPQPGDEITGPVDIVVNVADNGSASIVWQITVQPTDGSGEPRVIKEGSGPVDPTSPIAQFDPTVLTNDEYTVTLTVNDGYSEVKATIPCFVDGELKLGRYSVTFTDLSVPVAGVPMTVARRYDSFDSSTGDFGSGWRLALPGQVRDLPREGSGDWLAIGSKVYVTRPDGKRVSFRVMAVPMSWLFPFIVNVRFIPDDGSGDSLSVPGDPAQWQVGSQLWDYNPDTYILTTKEGVKYTIHEVEGLKKIEDRNGNTITVTPEGLFSSTGAAIRFERDAARRITRIIEPDDPTSSQAPGVLEYTYDSTTGNLASFRDQSGNSTRYVYDHAKFPHYLTEIVDPLGRRGVRNEYDDDGRLVANIDANGKRIEYARDIDARQEVYTDRMGNPTVLYYDERGNVIRQVDADGNQTDREYDAKDHLLKETDCAGRVKTFTYDANGNTLTETNCSGGVTTYTRNAAGDPLTKTDPNGNVTSYVYDANRNLVQETAADGGITIHAYDAFGKKVSTTNPRGFTEYFEYDEWGRQTAYIDYAGARTEYAYNAVGDRVKEARYRTTSPGVVEAVVAESRYDANHREVETIDAYGHSTKKDYDAGGKMITTSDALGQVTRNSYDPLGNLAVVQFPDGTSEAYTYDFEGRKKTLKNRDGFVTTYEYDKLGRMTKTIHPDATPGDLSDNSFTRTDYDCVGRILAQYDERGAATQYAYACQPNKQVVTDPAGGVTVHEYDPNGNRMKMTDALNRTTAYTYDAVNRLVRTTYPDGMSTETRFDKVGNKERDIDQVGRVTHYEHDGMDRLTAVVLADGADNLRTEYTYDELGNQLTQKDAEGRVTRFEYDKLAHRTARILPLGQREASEYDAAGRQVAKTDFNGATTRYEYDTAGRLVREIAPDAGRQEYAYSGSGKRTLERIVAPGGAAQDTVKQYDERGRLTLVTNPDGSKLAYGYDAHGNRTGLVTTTAVDSQTTVFAFDNLNRLWEVHDQQGGLTVYTYDAVGNRGTMTLPNGTVARYEYDALNRLTVLSNSRADNSIISRYVYTLSASGQRIRVDETTPAGGQRVVEYDYDGVYRLVGERITDPAADNMTISYAYDRVGNRLTRTVKIRNRTAVTGYSYDANDRLLGEQENTTVAWTEAEAGTRFASGGSLPPSRTMHWGTMSLGTLMAFTLLVPLQLLTRRPSGVGVRARRRRVFVTTVVLFVLPVTLLAPENVQAMGIQGMMYRVYGPLVLADTTSSTVTYAYDANGNTLTREKSNQVDRYTYDSHNRLIAAQNRTESASDTAFVYDVDGMRTGKMLDGTSSIAFLLDKNRDYAQVLVETTMQGTGDPETVNYVHGDDLLYMTRPTGPSYYQYDGQLSTRQLTDATGATTDTYAYDAFGVQVRSTGSTVNVYRYAGEYVDLNLGFQYLRARYFVNSSGRFASADAFEGNPTDPPSLHRYLYGRADPVQYRDRSGQMCESFALLMVCVILAPVMVLLLRTILKSLFERFVGNVDLFVNMMIAGLAAVGSAVLCLLLANAAIVGTLLLLTFLIAAAGAGWNESLKLKEGVTLCDKLVNEYVETPCNRTLPSPANVIVCPILGLLAKSYCNPFRQLKP